MLFPSVKRTDYLLGVITFLLVTLVSGYLDARPLYASFVPTDPQMASPGGRGASGPVLPSATVTFSWSPSNGAERYDLAVFDNTASTEPVNLSVFDTTYTVSLTGGHQYSWVVYACTSNGCSSGSELFFQTPASASSSATNINCTGGCPGSPSGPGPMTQNSIVTMNFAYFVNASTVTLTVDDLSEQTQPVNATVTGTSSYTAQLKPGHQYLWYVTPCNATGCSPPTTSLYFQTPGISSSSSSSASSRASTSSLKSSSSSRTPTSSSASSRRNSSSKTTLQQSSSATGQRASASSNSSKTLGGVTFVVQGMTFVNAGAFVGLSSFGDSLSDRYLEDALVAGRVPGVPVPDGEAVVLGRSESIYRIYWTRHPSLKDTMAGVATMKTAIKLAAGRGKTPINVVAHSWGTVISYIALAQLAKEDPSIKIKNFITMGSPIWMLSVDRTVSPLRVHSNRTSTTNSSIIDQIQRQVPSGFRGKPIALKNITTWTNFYNEADTILTVPLANLIYAETPIINSKVENCTSADPKCTPHFVYYIQGASSPTIVKIRNLIQSSPTP